MLPEKTRFYATEKEIAKEEGMVTVPKNKKRENPTTGTPMRVVVMDDSAAVLLLLLSLLEKQNKKMPSQTTRRDLVTILLQLKLVSVQVMATPTS